MNSYLNVGSEPSGDARPWFSSRSLNRRLLWLYLQGTTISIVVYLILALVGMEYTARQWFFLFFVGVPVWGAIVVGTDFYFLQRDYRPLGRVLARFDVEDTPTVEEATGALTRALNLPIHAFFRVTYVHGPLAALVIVAFMMFADWAWDLGFEVWQIVIPATAVFIVASPSHAILEYFGIDKHIRPVIEALWDFLDRPPQSPAKPMTISLRNKLIYLSVFASAIPLVFFTATLVIKFELLLEDLGIDPSFELMEPILLWSAAVAVVLVAISTAMSLAIARQVSRSASQLAGAMDSVEHGNLENYLHVTATDEFADLFRGFNLMTTGLREEAQILEIAHDIAGELNLGALLARVMGATTELLDADRSTLFLYDKKSGELFSRVAEGLEIHEIRIPADAGIAGAVFTTRQIENIDDPYSDPRFNRAVDQRTGYRTTSILALPIINKSGECIGITQVLNKHGGRFLARDEARLGSFTAQIAVALENAKLFEDVLNEKNYNDSILKSTSNGIFTLDSVGTILTANDAVLSILRADAADVVERPAVDLFGDTNSWLANSLDKAARTGHADIIVEADLVRLDGETASVNYSVSPLIDVAEEKIGSLAIIEDITTEKRVKSTMARYMSPEVADQLLASGEAELGGKDQHVSILFSDLRSFTTISEALGARETVAMLNEYFEHMVDVIMSNEGILDKFIGDAIMALFGVPFNGEQDADNALAVANGMYVELRALNERRASAGKDPLDIGVGISTGGVVVGNIGSRKRMEYTVIGDSVNLASRLEGATKYYGAKVLISEFTKNELKHSAALRELDLIRVKGKSEPVAIYEGLDHHAPETFRHMAEVIEAFDVGLSAYRLRDWPTARKCFETALTANSNDRPSQIYLDRILHFSTNPPPDDWDGVWTMTKK